MNHANEFELESSFESLTSECNKLINLITEENINACIQNTNQQEQKQEHKNKKRCTTHTSLDVQTAPDDVTTKNELAGSKVIMFFV